MDQVTNVMSVWDNGEVWPLRAPIYFEIKERGAVEVVRTFWEYKNATYEIDRHIYCSLDLLPDQTCFVAIDGNPGKHAYILNGDATIRFVLPPAFNMRKFDAERLADIQKSDEEDAKRRYEKTIPREQQVCFHSADTNDGKLEIFGDDGFGDCYYTYDWNTGELLSARTLPRRS